MRTFVEASDHVILHDVAAAVDIVRVGVLVEEVGGHGPLPQDVVLVHSVLDRLVDLGKSRLPALDSALVVPVNLVLKDKQR